MPGSGCPGWELRFPRIALPPGWIVGTYYDMDNTVYAFAARAVPKSATILLFGSSLLGLIGFRKKLKS